MPGPRRPRQALRRLAVIAGVVVAAVVSLGSGVANGAVAASTPSGSSGGSGGGSGSGGTGLTGGGSSGSSGSVPAPPGKHTRGRWLRGFTITEYWPAPEAWFVGRLVKAPGLPGLYPIDWLYSAMGMSMEGDGLGTDGSLYHISALGNGGWVTQTGKQTSPSDGWAAGSPYWRAGGYWRNHGGGVTFPLAAGGWSNGTGRRYVTLRNVRFAVGASLPLHYYQSIAVDPSVIPLGSRVYLPAYRGDGHGGWFVARDTGGAINGQRIDVYRPPPPSPNVSGRYLTRQRAFVIVPRRGH